MAVKRFGFSLDRVATPARAVQLPVQDEEGPVKKIPKLSDLIPITQGPQPPPYVRRQEKADVEIPIYKYTDDAASVWDHEDLKDGRMGIKLWQIQIIHEAHNPVTQGFYDTFNKFLQGLSRDSPDMPANIVELQQKALIKLVISGGGSDSSFVRFRPAFYVAGGPEALDNMIYLLDDFWVFLRREVRQDSPMITFRPHTGVNIDETWDHLQYPNVQLYDAAKRLPLSFSPFAAQPVQGRRYMTMTVQIDNDATVSARTLADDNARASCDNDNYAKRWRRAKVRLRSTA